MHFCGDELMAIAIALPFVGVVMAWLRSKTKMVRDWWAR